MEEIDPFDLLDAEAARIDRFYGGLSDADWGVPTRCAGWDRRDLLAHLLAVEDYTRAGLDGTVADLMGRAEGRGMDDFNAWGVRQRAGRTPAQLLAEWRELSAENRRRLRERGADAEIDTSVGGYPLGLQTYYLATELSIHAEDAGAPITDEERAERLAWMFQFACVALREAGRDDVTIGPDGDAVVARQGEDRVRLGREEFVSAAAGRLPADFPIPPSLRKRLTVFS
ncbi:maleylpyruvate isomerase family mycothiol-dependent enzyme [Rhizomonospora bruguierae]|uniref:maleylpyruvate isomerase family mycothiol-dependent enzyme n=1 Tax=Rhizomonospora bruguierae TaxID=1581705 RepID=UPI001BD1727A|nr:maleylpyruvate isomerase family mycothiol-dependent enzyme [Micromonospora sp. NBRC 107566]